MQSPFSKPNEKIQNEGCKKERYLTKKKEREERGQESKKPGIDPAIIEESRAASAARVAFHEPCHAMDGVRDTLMISNEQSVPLQSKRSIRGNGSNGTKNSAKVFSFVDSSDSSRVKSSGN
jgi:hypothetical protein